jgi:hypothetical protein
MYIIAGICIIVLVVLLVRNNIKLKSTANELNRMLYENAPIGINLFDENYTFTDFNNYVLNMLGAPAPNKGRQYDLVGDFSPEEQPDGTNSWEKARKIVSRAMGGEKQIFEWTLKSCTGEPVPCEVTTMYIKHKGKNIGLSYIYDLRHVKNMENVISQLKSELTESRISIMLSQIKPHFLYNALSAIAQLCEENPAKAKKATIDFAAYLRSNMDSLENEGLISFEKELKHIKSYLNLEKAIYGDALKVVYNIEANEFLLPPLTIQPIVENAVKHGIGKNEGGGTITINVTENNAEFCIIISDDGAGYDMNQARKGIGLDNVGRRLMEQCSGTLESISEKGAGTKVIIRIPKGGSE